MRKLASLAISVVMVATSVFGTNFVAMADSYGGFEYNLLGDFASITGYTGSDKDVVIPSQLNGHNVKFLAEHSLSKNKTMESLTIESNLQNISNTAVQYCTSMKSLSIPDTVMNLYAESFIYSTSLESITVNSANKTFDSRNNCNAIIKTASNQLMVGCKNTVIPDSVTSIAGAAFKGNGITSITIPSSVKSIGQAAFESCTSLTSVVIKDGVTTIGTNAFYGCTNLKSIVIPSSVTEIGSNAFFADSNVTIYAPSGSTAAKYAAANGVAVSNDSSVVSQSENDENKDDDSSDSDSGSNSSSVSVGKVKLSSAKNVKKKSILVKWKKVSGANGYQVQYSLKKNFSKKKTKTVKKLKLKIKKLKKKKTYFVRVRAYKIVNGTKKFGKWSGKKRVKIRK